MYKIPAGTLFLGKNLLILPECPSTNTQAATLSQSGQAPEGTVVITHHQTAGRGQRGNTWQSGKGLNLTFSAVLHPVFLTPGEQFQLNKAVALAIHDVVKMYVNQPVKIKWPNDIMIGDKKTCGILIENQITADRLTRSIVGIGLNVNQADFDSPQATSISVHSGKPIDLAEVFGNLMPAMERRYLQLRSQESEVRSQKSEVRSQKSEVRSQESEVRSQESEVRSQKSGVRSQESEARSQNEDYLKNLYRFNEKRKFVVADQETEGVIRNVDTDGRLIVEINNEKKSFDLKEIKYVY